MFLPRLHAIMFVRARAWDIVAVSVEASGLFLVPLRDTPRLRLQIDVGVASGAESFAEHIFVVKSAELVLSIGGASQDDPNELSIVLNRLHSVLVVVFTDVCDRLLRLLQDSSVLLFSVSAAHQHIVSGSWLGGLGTRLKPLLLGHVPELRGASLG